MSGSWREKFERELQNTGNSNREIRRDVGTAKYAKHAKKIRMQKKTKTECEIVRDMIFRREWLGLRGLSFPLLHSHFFRVFRVFRVFRGSYLSPYFAVLNEIEATKKEAWDGEADTVVGEDVWGG